jgi:hypothetical protein
VAESREQLEAIVREDPFCARGLAEARIVEFRASQRADAIDQAIAGDARRMGATRRPSAKQRR